MAYHTPPQPNPSLHDDTIYHPEADLENLEEYVPGGFHPISVGDTFCDGRYTVVHKLGFGGYSTIWLARDRQLNRYVSLKIFAARVSASSKEGTILRLLANGDSSYMGKQFVPPLLDPIRL
jgi:serine/threonine-protein kinase SRPK3